MEQDADEALNRLEAVSLARLAYAMLHERGGQVDADALIHLERAIELLEATIAQQRRAIMQKH